MKLSNICVDGGTQVRVRIHEETVSDYAESMQAGVQFPPIVLFHDGSGYFVGDGFHRVLAATRIGREEIEAEIRKGTATDALWFALGANKENGLRMNHEDKKHAILLALKTWPERSQTQIAEQIGCCQQFVSQIKAKLEATTTSNLPSRVTGRDGKSYPAKRNQMTKAERVEKIRELSGKGFHSGQIASKIGICDRHVSSLASEAGIALADSLIRRRRKMDINRIIQETANGAESLVSGLELINGNLEVVDVSKIDIWVTSLHTCVSSLNNLIAKLKRRKSNGESNGREIR